MFICSTKAYIAKSADGETLRIPRGFVGEIPEKFASAKIIALAIKDGSISTPASKKDSTIEKAIEEGEKKAVEAQKAKEKKSK